MSSHFSRFPHISFVRVTIIFDVSKSPFLSLSHFISQYSNFVFFCFDIIAQYIFPFATSQTFSRTRLFTHIKRNKNELNSLVTGCKVIWLQKIMSLLIYRFFFRFGIRHILTHTDTYCSYAAYTRSIRFAVAVAMCVCAHFISSFLLAALPISVVTSFSFDRYYFAVVVVAFQLYSVYFNFVWICKPRLSFYVKRKATETIYKCSTHKVEA